MKKRRYQYIVLNDGEDCEPTVEQVLEQVAEDRWGYFESYSSQGFVADEILGQKYADWEMFDEDDAVYIAIQECVENAELEVYRASICYQLSVTSEAIYLDDDFKAEKNRRTLCNHSPQTNRPFPSRLCKCRGGGCWRPREHQKAPFFNVFSYRRCNEALSMSYLP